jgi:hypothetical protein
MSKQIDKAIVINWKVTIREKEGNEHHFHTLLFKQIVNVINFQDTDENSPEPL